MQEGVVALHHVVAGHVDGDDAPRLAGHLHCPRDKFLVLNQVAFDMEVVVAFEVLGFEVFRTHFKRRAHVAGEGALGVGPGDEDHAAAGTLGAGEHGGAHSELLHAALEELAQFVVANLSYVAGRHAEDGSAGDGVGRRAAGHVLDPYLLEGSPDAVAGFLVHMLHASKGQMVGAQEFCVGQYRQHVREGVAYSEYRLHNLQK